jgi:hypothetical protein
MKSFLPTCSLSVSWLDWLQGVSQRLGPGLYLALSVRIEQQAHNRIRIIRAGIILGPRRRLRGRGLLQQQWRTVASSIRSRCMSDWTIGSVKS